MERSGVVNVFLSVHSPRASWIFRLMFEELLGLSLHLTTDRSELIEYSGAALNYSQENIPGIPAIRPAGILSESEIRPHEIIMDKYDGLPVFFSVDGGDLPFDPFAMAFYLVSRYEEYLPFKADIHGRFSHTESLAYREGFLETALVDRLAILLKDLLTKSFSTLRFRQDEYSFTPTVDIDIAYAHLGKGAVRTIGALAKHVLKFDIKEVNNRFRSMLGISQDPYDNFDLILDECKKHELDPVFFVLAGDKGPNDRNLSLSNKRFSNLVKSLSTNAKVGVHPSYRSGDEPYRLTKEINGLSGATFSDITLSRQHFVRMQMPSTYEQLLVNGISHDYSMGYAGASGFRASVARPFNFYNLAREEETALRIVPFMFMDSTLDDYLGIEPKHYLENVKPVIDEVKDVKGQLCAIWHNYAIANHEEKIEAFKTILKYASDK